MCECPTSSPEPVGFSGTRRALVPTGIGDQSSNLVRVRVSPTPIKTPPRSMCKKDGHLNLAARVQNFQRHVIAVATDPEIDA